MIPSCLSPPILNSEAISKATKILSVIRWMGTKKHFGSSVLPLQAQLLNDLSLSQRRSCKLLTEPNGSELIELPWVSYHICSINILRTPLPHITYEVAHI